MALVIENSVDSKSSQNNQISSLGIERSCCKWISGKQIYGLVVNGSRRQAKYIRVGLWLDRIKAMFSFLGQSKPILMDNDKAIEVSGDYSASTPRRWYSSCAKSYQPSPPSPPTKYGKQVMGNIALTGKKGQLAPGDYKTWSQCPNSRT
jgi:hypothetical protein